MMLGAASSDLDGLEGLRLLTTYFNKWVGLPGGAPVAGGEVEEGGSITPLPTCGLLQ